MKIPKILKGKKAKGCSAALTNFMRVVGQTPKCSLPIDGHIEHHDRKLKVIWSMRSDGTYQKVEQYA